MRGDTSQAPRFIVDAMLGKLARKLRLYGFDTLFGSDLDDEQLLETAMVQRRMLITSDEELAERAWRRQIPVHLVSESDEARTLARLFRALKVERALIPERARCTKCNAPVAVVERERVKDRVPPGVLRMHEKFYICRSCGSVYWHGSHWSRLRALHSRVERLMEVEG